MTRNWYLVEAKNIEKKENAKKLNDINSRVPDNRFELRTLGYFANESKLSEATVKRWSDEVGIKLFTDKELDRLRQLRDYNPNLSERKNAELMDITKDEVRGLKKWISDNENEEWFKTASEIICSTNKDNHSVSEPKSIIIKSESREKSSEVSIPLDSNSTTNIIVNNSNVNICCEEDIYNRIKRMTPEEIERIKALFT